ncbi:ABC transporter permease [candidate division KSB1 bacterium]|nr:ABC transporter permease [candidate division KSB1 bacterium]
MLMFKLALRNILGAGLRTWLNVIVLSFSFVAIIYMQGIYDGMQDQASQAEIQFAYGGGQYWHAAYDPYDPFSLQDSHGKIAPELQDKINDGEATPVLIVQGSMYPNGRLKPVLLKGIDPAQKTVAIPSAVLAKEKDAIPALIGARTARNSGLKIGDYVTIRWRDANGTFDAQEVKIMEIMNTLVQSIDNGQIWMPLEQLRQLSGMPDEATLVILGQETDSPAQVSLGWVHKDMDFLLKDLKQLVKTKTIGASVMYIALLLLAMLAIFDTQVLSLFRRRKEIGTLVSLGMTRVQVIKLFTFEGAMHGILAAGVAALYGIPLFIYSAKAGWKLPQVTEGYGLSIGQTLFPVFGAGLVVGTIFLVMITVTIVSYLPTRRILKLKPTDALRGKMS